jgi:hypothetical protein
VTPSDKRLELTNLSGILARAASCTVKVPNISPNRAAVIRRERVRNMVAAAGYFSR